MVFVDICGVRVKTFGQLLTDLKRIGFKQRVDVSDSMSAVGFNNLPTYFL